MKKHTPVDGKVPSNQLKITMHINFKKIQRDSVENVLL
jgi:hypothetical protein